MLSVCQDPRVHAFRLNGSLVLEIDLRGDARAYDLWIHDRLHRRRDFPERRRGEILGQPDRTHLKGVIQARLAQQQGR